MLDHEKLDVYQCAKAFLGLAKGIVRQVPRGYADLADQLRRASVSISNNIAEGTGKTSPDDRKRIYAIARGSALECGAILDCLTILDVPETDTERAKQLLTRIVSMLSKMSR